MFSAPTGRLILTSTGAIRCASASTKRSLNGVTSLLLPPYILQPTKKWNWQARLIWTSAAPLYRTVWKCATFSPTCAERASASWPELEGKKVVLFLSRINFKKGLDILAPAFGRVLRCRSDAHLVLAGPDTDGYEARVRRWLAQEGALQNVTFTGLVEKDRKMSLLKRANLFVLPSYTENFGISVVEAMAAGLPVLVSNRVNIWREIHNAGAGIVVNPDVTEVAEAVLRLLENPSLAKEMGAQGRRVARERFSWESVGERLVGSVPERCVPKRRRALTRVTQRVRRSYQSCQARSVLATPADLGRPQLSLIL